MLLYLKIFLLCFLIWISYVFLIWKILKWTTDINISSPFVFDKSFWKDFKKFALVYFLSDLVRFVFELIILWLEWAIIIRLVSTMITLGTSGFFAWWRAFVIKKLERASQRNRIFREFIGDTFASLVFRVPMYVIQLIILVKFGLVGRESVLYWVYLQMWSIMIFGRFTCFLADFLEKKLLNQKK